MRNLGSIVLLGLLAFLASAQTNAAPRSPNIVLIFADDVGWGDVGFNGRRTWQTPNLDALASQGITLRRFYSGATVCAPSRGVLLSGQYTIHSGVTGNNEDLPASKTTIAEALRSAGYATALFGKWHHGKPPEGQKTYTHPMDQGFDEFFGFTDAVHAWEKFPKQLWHGREKKPVEGYADDLFIDHGVDFIAHHRDEPFFLYLPLISGHFMIDAPSDEVQKHRGRFDEADPSKPLNATYAAMITRLDQHVGQVMKALEDNGLTENTMLVFTSDHGATFEGGNQGTAAYHDSNAPFRGQKRTLWEGGIRVPTCARWPGHIPAGSESSEPMHMMDLYPTFLDVAGAKPEVSQTLDGVSLLPAWTGTGHVPERTLFWEWRVEGSHQLAAMKGDRKLVLTEKGKPELFDLELDPSERRNVAASHPALVKDLNEQLQAWLDTESGNP